MFVKPAPGIKVRDPFSRRHIPESGAEVPEASYWIRRIKSGDVVLVPSPVVQIPQIPIPDSKSAPKAKE